MTWHDLAYDLGRWSVEGIWIPLLAWTLVALPLYLVLRTGSGIPVHVRYGGLFALTAALPVGVVAAAVVTIKASAVDGIAVVTLPAVTFAPSGASPSPAWWWTPVHTAGVAVAVAALLAAWRIGCLVVARRHLRQYLSAAVPAPDWVRAETDALAQRLGPRRSVRVFLSDAPCSPLTFGWRRPAILLPQPLLEDRSATRLTLVHELIHIRRADYLLQWTDQLIGALFFVHPLVALLRRETSILREITCDADVLARTDDRSGYARLLYRFATTESASRKTALGILQQEHHLRKRILAMKQQLFDFKGLDRSKRLGMILSAVLLTVAVAVVACSDVLVRSTDESSRSGAPHQNEDVLVVTDQMPQLIGGLASIQENLRYPAAAKEAGVEGRVILQFIVDENGDVRDPRIVRGIGSGLDEAAIDAVKTARFRPGMKDGEPVKVKMSLPVTFRLGPESVRQVPGEVDVELEEGVSVERKEGVNLDRKEGVNVELEEGDVFVVVERMPELQGGLASIANDIQYPAIAIQAGIEGRVIVQFIVDESGAVQDASVVRGVGAGLDEEALRAVRNARFTPGEKDGRPVKVRMSLPVTFKLPGDDAGALKAE